MIYEKTLGFARLLIRKSRSFIRLPTGVPTTTKLSRGVGAASDIASQLYDAFAS